MRRYLLSFLAMGLISSAANCLAQSTPVGRDAGVLVQPGDRPAALGNDLFGESVTLYTGETEFKNIDVSIPGNNALPVEVGRRYVVHDEGHNLSLFAPRVFGDWDLEIPHLHGVFADMGTASGWTVSTSGAPNNRCSVDPSNYLLGTPPIANGTPAYPFSSAEYWFGNSLYIPGEGDKKLMVIDPANGNRPTDGNSTYWVTPDQYTVSCLPSTANGVPGEAFLVHGPDGIKYTFNWFVKRAYTALSKPYSVCTGGCNSTLNRNEEWILPTHIEDRFGNYVNYSYDAANPWHLTTIASSDGRTISLAYDTSGRVSTVTAGGKQWTYSYGAQNALSTVTLPDLAHSWTYDFTTLHNAISGYSLHSDCADPPSFASGSPTAVIHHPSGAVGTFTFTGRRHGRSNVPMNCSYLVGGDSYATEFNVIDAVSLDKKQIDGAGLSSSQIWNYDYGPANASWKATCDASGCPVTRTIKVTNPDGSWESHIVSNQYNVNEGMDLEVDVGDASGTKRSQVITYQSPTGQPYPATIGKSPCNRCDKEGQAFAPVSTVTLTQDQTTFQWVAQSFDAMARPLSVVKSNSASFTRTDATSYVDNKNLWLIGQVASTSVNGTETDRVDYSAATGAPTNRYAYGKLRQSFTYNADGTLATMSDGLHSTTYGTAWKDGKPLSVTYPDGGHATSAVDDLGRLSSATDPESNTVSLSYDDLGNLSRVIYPASAQAWADDVSTSSFSVAAERGIPANHWVRTESRGQSSTVSYLDVHMRPILVDKFVVGSSSPSSTVRIDYDWAGRVIFQSDPRAGFPAWNDATLASAGSSTQYDVLGRVTRQARTTAEPGITQVTTNEYLSNLVEQTTDPNGAVTTTTYQAFDEPDDRKSKSVSAPDGVIHEITLDIWGFAHDIHQYGTYNGVSADVTRHLYYDSNYQLCRSVDPESGSTFYGYDAAGNVAWLARGGSPGTGCLSSEPAGATDYTYDGMNRLHQVAAPPGTQSSTYLYSPAGHMTQADSGATHWSASYNSLGEISTEALQIDGQQAWQVGYRYTPAGGLNYLDYPNQTSVYYAADDLGRPTQVGAYASAVHYFPDGTLSDFTYGNGELYTQEQNERLLLKNFTYGSGTTLEISEDYAYDNVGNTLSVIDRVGTARSRTFHYDELGRLKDAQSPGSWSEAFVYDPVNNIVSRSGALGTVTFTYGADNLLHSTSAGGSYTYDPLGNVTTRGGTTLSFDKKNQLISLGASETYQYDAFGHRVSKTLTGGSAEYYFYTSNGTLLYQFNAGQSTSIDYIYLGSRLIARDENPQLGAPASLTFDANPNNGSFTATWPGVPTATTYTLQESTDQLNWSSVSSGAALTASIAGKQGGTYFYRVQACTSSACGPFTSSIGVGVRPTLPTVTAPTVTINGTYNVSWSTPVTATSFDVQEKLGNGAWTTIAAGTPATSISRPGTTSGTYSYQVSANSAYGTRGWSAVSTVTVDTTYGVLPTGPATFAVPATSADGSAVLSWSSATLATTYTVEQSSNGGSTWSQVYSGASTSFSLSGLGDGTYQFHVKACNTYGCQGWVAGNSSLTVTHPPTSGPTLSVPSTSANGIYSVSWSTVPLAASYALSEQVNGGAWTVLQTSAALSRPISGKPNGAYAYRVQACNAGGCGPFSGTGTVTVLLPPGAPASISAPGSSTGTVGVTWSGAATASYYNLYQQLNGGGYSLAYQGGATSASPVESSSGSYVFSVQACNASGCSGLTASAAVSVLLVPGVPAIPSISQNTSNHKVTVLVGCSSVAGATSYNTEETLPNATTPQPITNICGYNNFVYGTGIVKFRERACNASGCSAWSGYAQIYVNSN